MTLKRNLPVRRAAAYALVFLPAVLAFLYVYRFGVNVVWRDQWTIVNHFASHAGGNLGFWQFWAEHNEHRILFPRLAMFGLGLLTDYDARAEMYLILACFLVTLVALLLVFRRGSRDTLLFFLPVAFLVFSLRQYGNMLWGFQLTFAFVQVFGVLTLCSLYLLGRGRLRLLAFPAAVASGMVASLSAAQGLLVWPVGFVQVLLSPLARTAKVWLAGLWGLLGTGIWTFYLLEQRSGYGASPAENLSRPAAVLEFVLALLGGSLFWQQGPALAGGLLLAGLAAASLWLAYRHERSAESCFWLALVLFGVLTLASIALGRADSGTGQATISRYTTFSILAVIGTYVLLMKAALGKRSLATAGLFGTITALVVLSVPNSYLQAIEAGGTGRAQKERAAEILSSYESYPDEVLEEAHGWQNIRGRAGVLERLGYSVFADNAAGGRESGSEARGYPAYPGSLPAERISSRVIAFRSFSERMGSPTGHSIPISGSSQRIAPSARAL